MLVTVTQIKGSAPQIIGAKMLVTRNGLYWGTVGGGKVEAHCIEYAMELLQSKIESHARNWNLQKDIGMSCGGEMTFFFDVQQSTDWHVCIFGAGHIAQELCRVLQRWSCQISVFDTRAEWLERLPSSDNLERNLCEDLKCEVQDLPDNSLLLCMTMGHATDLPILFEAFKVPNKFKMIGVIGSTVKAKKIKKELGDLGVSQEDLNTLISPLGFPIGNNTPSEIAMSICSQLLAKRDKKSFCVENGVVC